MTARTATVASAPARQIRSGRVAAVTATGMSLVGMARLLGCEDGMVAMSLLELELAPT